MQSPQPLMRRLERKRLRFGRLRLVRAKRAVYARSLVAEVLENRTLLAGDMISIEDFLIGDAGAEPPALPHLQSGHRPSPLSGCDP